MVPTCSSDANYHKLSPPQPLYWLLKRYPGIPMTCAIRIPMRRVKTPMVQQ